MSRRTEREYPREEYVQTSAVVQTFIQRIYNNILKALESGMDLSTALETHMPLILNELDKIIIMYPFIGELFISTVKKMWYRWFKDIPMPSLDPNESVVTIFVKIKEELLKHKDKFRSSHLYASYTSTDIETQIGYTALSFMHSVCSFVFTLLGMVI